MLAVKIPTCILAVYKHSNHGNYSPFLVPLNSLLDINLRNSSSWIWEGNGGERDSFPREKSERRDRRQITALTATAGPPLILSSSSAVLNFSHLQLALLVLCGLLIGTTQTFSAGGLSPWFLCPFQTVAAKPVCRPY